MWSPCTKPIYVTVSYLIFSDGFLGHAAYRTDFIIFCLARVSEKLRLSSVTWSQTNNTAPNIYYHRRVMLIEEVAFAFYSDLWKYVALQDH